MKSLVLLGKEFGLIPADFRHEQNLMPKKGDKEKTWDIWAIRNDALSRKISDIELFRVLYHIAKHRGFHFHTRAEELQQEDANSEQGKVKAGMARISKMLKESGCRTIGQMFWQKFEQTNEKNKRKRNTKDKYENAIPRTLLRDEAAIILAKQKEFGNQKITDELQRRYIDEILMHEEGPDDDKLQKMMSRCEFTGDLCAPQESYTAERFRLFNRLNVLELVDTNKCEEHVQLKPEQRKTVEELAYKNSKVTFTQIRNELNLSDCPHLRFNLCSYREHNPEYNNKLVCAIKNERPELETLKPIPVVDVQTGELRILDDEVKKIFRSKKLWKNAKQIYVYYSDIRKQLILPGEFKFVDLESKYTKSAAELEKEAKAKSGRSKHRLLSGEAAYIKQFEDKDIFISLEGYHKIQKALENICGKETWEQNKQENRKLDTMAEALTYCKSDATRREYLCKNGITDNKTIDALLSINMKKLANFSLKALKQLLKHMERGQLFHEAKEQCGYGELSHEKCTQLKPYSGFYEKNPVVARVISQTRKLINTIVRTYNSQYPIDQIHIEVATELANSKKRKEEISRGQARYREDKRRAEERCRDHEIDPQEGQNLLMFRLAEEQNNRCPYTNKAIVFYPTGANEEVYIRDCEVDHIIPMSRSFNDSLNNKVLCSPEANQNKTDRIPFEWFEERFGKDSQEWMEFDRRVAKMYGMPYPKKKNLTRKSWTEEDKEKFITRNLNDTRYATRHIADYLRKYFDFSASPRSDIKDVSRIQLRSGGVTSFLRHMW
ncbi:MAG: type II CRISPR RNA-guided endonuclease Cas9, partial [Candidatus Aureabacteria bacterium]|nr:type II CRISPR RNA-guided endonuclease Cas9 [Candidatus Auribacterota bacterium]